MQPNTERRTVTIAAQGYNDCFCLANKSKQVMYVNKNGELRKAHKKDDNYYHRYHLYYEEAQDTIAYYNHVNGGGDTLSISLYLENAQYNGRHILTLDFDKLVDAQGNKEPIDTESPAFKDLQEAADIVTRSTSGGYHMYYGIDKQKADTLFQEINLLCATEGSYVCKVRQFSADKRIKVDFFCDTPRLIYEPNGWDINKPLTDKTEVICELIKKHFLFAAEQKQAPKREKQTVSKEHKRQRTHREYADIEELDEADLTAQMDALQLSVFRHLMGNISPNCSRPEWYKHGINILCVFGPELGGEVFYFWSKDYADFDYSEMRTEWSAIVSKEDAELRNKDWQAILDGKVDSQKAPLTWDELLEMAPEYKPVFRDKPIQWIHEKAEQVGGKDKHWIQWGEQQYQRSDFFKAAYGAEYNKFPEKVVFTKGLDDKVLWLSTGQRTALEYMLMAHRHKGDITHMDNLEALTLVQFFASDSCSTSKDTSRRIAMAGFDNMIAFGASRKQDGAAQHTWCYTRDYIYKDVNGEQIPIGIQYRGAQDNWSDWAASIKAAYERFESYGEGELFENMYQSMYTRLPKKGEVDGIRRMTYTTEPGGTYELVQGWILGHCKGEFPLQGETPHSDFEFTVMFDTDEVEYRDNSERLKEYNKEHKEELKQAKAAAKSNKDRTGILEHLSDENQEFTRDDLHEWGYSDYKITRLKKQGIIEKVKVKQYRLLAE